VDCELKIPKAMPVEGKGAHLSDFSPARR
jgi:hypothetical protein